MTEVRVKICGLSGEETLDAALDAGADLVEIGRASCRERV